MKVIWIIWFDKDKDMMIYMIHDLFLVRFFVTIIPRPIYVTMYLLRPQEQWTDVWGTKGHCRGGDGTAYEGCWRGLLRCRVVVTHVIWIHGQSLDHWKHVENIFQLSFVKTRKIYIWRTSLWSSALPPPLERQKDGSAGKRCSQQCLDANGWPTTTRGVLKLSSQIALKKNMFSVGMLVFFESPKKDENWNSSSNCWANLEFGKRKQQVFGKRCHTGFTEIHRWTQELQGAAFARRRLSSGDGRETEICHASYQGRQIYDVLTAPQKMCVFLARLKQFLKFHEISGELQDNHRLLLKFKMRLRRFEQPRLVFFPDLRVPMVSGTWNTSHPNQHALAQVWENSQIDLANFR